MKKEEHFKKRPVRLYLDNKGRYFFLERGKKKFLKLNHPQSKLHGHKVNQKQIVKVVINHPEVFRHLKKRKRVKKDIDKIIFQKPIIKHMTEGPIGYHFDNRDVIDLHNKISKLNEKIGDEPKPTIHLPQVELPNSFETQAQRIQNQIESV